MIIKILKLFDYWTQISIDDTAFNKIMKTIIVKDNWLKKNWDFKQKGGKQFEEGGVGLKSWMIWYCTTKETFDSNHKIISNFPYFILSKCDIYLIYVSMISIKYNFFYLTCKSYIYNDLHCFLFSPLKIQNKHFNYIKL